MEKQYTIYFYFKQNADLKFFAQKRLTLQKIDFKFLVFKADSR